ncbi:3120_t:CDS:2 [Cetraspora pellucida]|uniref:3120_t:CDS:1 n=1 Tax=Cetraspora pellucida TaxID=1433469 RepID=A0A9N9FG13_9GLOM|nr:3120_t:CDS:2 [Cetraspora pellucida]
MSYSSVVWIDDPFFIKRQRVQMACSFCRHRKIRCDGRNPCANCKKYSTSCTYISTTSNDSSIFGIQTSHGKRPLDDVTEHQTLPPALRRNPTSQGMFSAPSPQSSTILPSNSISVAKPEPKLPLIDDHVIPPDDIVEHLLELYWTNVHPYVPVLNKSIFLQQRESPDDPPSLLLLNAMFAVAAEFSDRPSVRTDPESHEKGGWIFFDRARNILDSFLDAPRMSTIAALILMSIYQQHNTRRSGISPGYFRRWMYIGMAIRMALELDLNKDCDDPHLDRSHKELRKPSNIEEEECTIPEPDDNVNEPELKVDGALREFIHQIKFTRMLHLLLKHNFSYKVSTTSPYLNQDSIVANFEDQIQDWFSQLPIQTTHTTESLIDNSNNYSTTMLHLRMLYYSFIILLHRRYILNQDSLSKCIRAAQEVTPIGASILRNYSSPFRGFLNCTTWCLLQAGMIHALNKVVGNEASCRVAEEHYEKIVHLFQEYSQTTALQVLQDHANTCSSHRLSVIDVWSSSDNPPQQSPEMFVFSPGSKVGNINSNLPNNHIINNNDTPSFLLSPPTVKSSIPSIDHPPCFPSIDVDVDVDNLYEHPNMHTDLTNNYSNMVSFQSLQYGATTLHMSPATTTNTFDTPHISQITTPFSSPHNGTISPLCGTTPHQSPDVDLGPIYLVRNPQMRDSGPIWTNDWSD